MSVLPTRIAVLTVVEITLVLMSVSVLMDSNLKLTTAHAKVCGQNVCVAVSLPQMLSFDSSIYWAVE